MTCIFGWHSCPILRARLGEKASSPLMKVPFGEGVRHFLFAVCTVSQFKGCAFDPAERSVFSCHFLSRSLPPGQGASCLHGGHLARGWGQEFGLGDACLWDGSRAMNIHPRRSGVVACGGSRYRWMRTSRIPYQSTCWTAQTGRLESSRARAGLTQVVRAAVLEVPKLANAWGSGGLSRSLLSCLCLDQHRGLLRKCVGILRLANMEHRQCFLVFVYPRVGGKKM